MGVPTAAAAAGDHAVCERGSHIVPVQNVWHMRVHHDSNDSTEGLMGLDDSLAYPYQDRGSSRTCTATLRTREEMLSSVVSALFKRIIFLLDGQ